MLSNYHFLLIFVVLLVGKTIHGSREETTKKSTTLGWNPRKVYRDKSPGSYEDKYDKKKYDDDRSDNYKRYDDDDDDDDDDYSDRKPSRKVYKKKPDSVGSMNIYIKQKGKGKKSTYKKYRFPAARYDHKKHPKFGSLVSLAPSLPVLVDRLTKQTFFFTPVGGIIVVPPIVNFIGKVIPIAHLILSGYASLVSTGAPLLPGANVGPLVDNKPVVGPNVPKIDPQTGDFKGAVRVNYEPPRPVDPPAYGERANPRQPPKLVYSEPEYRQPPPPQYQPPPPPQYQPPPPPPQYQPPPPQYQEQPPPPQYQEQPPPQYQPQPPQQLQPDRPFYGGGGGGAQAPPGDQFPQPNYPDPIIENGQFDSRRSSFNGEPEPNYPSIINA